MANFPPVGAPTIEKWERLADKYPVERGPEFADGGRDTFCASTTPIRTWVTIARGMTVAEAAIFDAWHAGVLGEHLPYTLTDRDGATYGGVKCVGYERGHEGFYEYGQFRKITHEDRP
ncbi:MAG TPA: hypothetical protein VF297_05265 [Pyrinomonadaceae bacterium]